MRPFTIREEDGSAIAALCEVCGAEIYEGGTYYYADGQYMCPCCFDDYEKSEFALTMMLLAGGEEIW